MGFVLRARLILLAVLGLLVLILAGSVRALAGAAPQLCCPPQDQAGFPLGETRPGPPLFCSYPAEPGDPPDLFFCTYDPNTGVLI